MIDKAEIKTLSSTLISTSIESLALTSQEAFAKLGLSNPPKRAWDFAVDVMDKSDKNPTPEFIVTEFERHALLKESEFPAENKLSMKQPIRNTHKKNEITKEFDDHAKSIIASDKSINEKTRLLTALGYLTSPIAKALGKDYQRIRNVQKIQEKMKLKRK